MATPDRAAPAAPSPAPCAAPAAGVVHVAGDMLRPAALSLAQLVELPSTVCEPFALRCFTSGRHIRDVERYRGVRLTELITRAGLRDPASGDFKRTIFLAIGHDGYAVTFSWHELFNTAVGEQAIVAHECGGRPLTAEAGGPLLFSGADISPAPRHVKRLASLVARVIAP
ncbi:molybdopterin-dependent oxidoreductase [Burkholderia glumae]|uniref:Molybdopterin-dependent oxidoreductase n=2 Tax=Burkholderia glumae TaxID=337 RepID=A0AAP9XXN6_BURGL|nr:molybdopterin-dependent oxidoreductase [Burkholderia glumae]ACR30993.1 putative oxidoreductase molybdopterin binding protein [Burkholderia glumae BGR1]AJY62893.1 oxidoreductase molybdopterin binding domain protein [Burkholderia glumae LMG 2196 = ATCC 33617]KHJ64144.1 molybdopterin-binding protein [Burkholderia glumae]MCM2483684.1 molybdopterin-dependent oxidoreductase [Burkholderia glumae]MCM2509386.1 molybdopterin-dependent oxidoreductase [Burkholderia glumae]